MADYTKTVTAAGLGLLTDVANANGTLEFTQVKCGDGAIGAGDPAALTDIINSLQTFDAVDTKTDSLGQPYAFFQTNNEGLAAGYLRRELGLFARLQGTPATETLLAYFHAPTDGDADYIPVPEEGIASIQTFRVQLVQATGLDADVVVDQSTVFLDLARWAAHLAGGGGVDQHPLATQEAAGLQSAVDKANWDNHIYHGGNEHPKATADTNGFMTGTDRAWFNNWAEGLAGHVGSRGTTAHAVTTDAEAGFFSPAYKSKLDGIQANAQVNAYAFGRVQVDGVNVDADEADAMLTVLPGSNIQITPEPLARRLTISAANLAPLSHVGAGAGAHALAGATHGFMSASDKSKLDTVAVNADVNPAYWSLRRNYGYTGPFIDFLNQAASKWVGQVVSPGGGASIIGAGYVSVIEMRVNNVTANPVTKSLYICRNGGDVSYQIDTGALNVLKAAAGSNSAVNVTIPAGLHVLRLYFVDDLVFGDWLDAQVVWAAGGHYY
jgi:hypothetical protein